LTLPQSRSGTQGTASNTKRPAACAWTAALTSVAPGGAALSSRLATLTVSPHASYSGRCVPITPATAGPAWMPMRRLRSVPLARL